MGEENKGRLRFKGFEAKTPNHDGLRVRGLDVTDRPVNDEIAVGLILRQRDSGEYYRVESMFPSISGDTSRITVKLIPVEGKRNTISKDLEHLKLQLAEENGAWKKTDR